MKVLLKTNVVAVILFLSLSFVSSVHAAEETIRIYALESDSHISLDDENFDDWNFSRNFTGTVLAEPNSEVNYLFARTDKGDGAWRILRIILPFDTSVVPEDAAIQSVRLNLFGLQNRGDTTGIVTEHFPADPADLQSTDWNIANFSLENFGNIKQEDDVWNVVELNPAGIEAVNPDGYSTFGILTEYDFFDTPPTDGLGVSFIKSISFASANSLGTSTDPYLEITYTVPDEPEIAETIEELTASLNELIEGLPKKVQKSYDAHLKKVEGFVEKGLYRAALQQVAALEHKIGKDIEQEVIEEALGDELLELVVSLSELVFAEALANANNVPLITQIESPYPSLAETSAWADEFYANGSAGNGCLTIAECGCAITSMVMLGQSYGLTKGVDGKTIDPGNMNAWLEANEGYTSGGGLMWLKAVEYMSEKNPGTLELTSFGEKNTDAIRSFVENVGPAVAFNEDVNRGNGHYFVLSELFDENSFSVRDPYWYETTTTDDGQDLTDNVQGYGDSITKTNLFTFNKKQAKLSRAIEIHLGSPAELVLTDSQGKKTGSIGSEILIDIPGSSYDREVFINTTGAVADPHKEKVLMVLLPEDDVYTLDVIGTGEGVYDLTIATVNENGNVETEFISGTTSVGQVDSYLVEVDGGDEVSDLIAAVEALITDWVETDQRYILNKLRVIEEQLEKRNVVAADSIISGLFRYIDGIAADEVGEVLELLAELVS